MNVLFLTYFLLKDRHGILKFFKCLLPQSIPQILQQSDTNLPRVWRFVQTALLRGVVLLPKVDWTLGHGFKLKMIIVIAKFTVCIYTEIM